MLSLRRAQLRFANMAIKNSMCPQPTSYFTMMHASLLIPLDPFHAFSVNILEQTLPAMVLAAIFPTLAVQLQWMTCPWVGVQSN
jgi:hypothetical protein